jgi:hypothetical protein
MRSVELAVFADALAAEAAALNARLERARSRLRRAAIEREAREALPGDMVGRLGRLGLLEADGVADTAELDAIRLDVVAVERLQSWIEVELSRASAGPGADRPGVVRQENARAPEAAGLGEAA